MKTSKKQTRSLLLLVTISIFVISSCTKKRDAEFADDTTANNIFAISEFEDSNSVAQIKVVSVGSLSAPSNNGRVDDSSQKSILSKDNVKVGDRLKFMFDGAEVRNSNSGEFNVVFTVDSTSVTAYKLANSIDDLSTIERNLAISNMHLKILAKKIKTKNELEQGIADSKQVRAGRKISPVAIPLFKYAVTGKGIIVRAKNDLKEETSLLQLKDTDWKDATHIQIESKVEKRQNAAMDATSQEVMKDLFYQSSLENRLSTVEQLESDFKVGLKFIPAGSNVITKLDNNELLVYQISDTSKLTEEQLRIFKEGDTGGQILSCTDALFNKAIQNPSDSCVVILAATVPVDYKQVELSTVGTNGETSSTVQLKTVPKSQSGGFVVITENSQANQQQVTGILDPNSAIKVSEIKGEFLFRRTFEDSASGFLGRTGTSGDMIIVKFELEDDRVVVRNQLSLIKYTGQGPKDREEIMSFPARYFKVKSLTNDGTALVLKNLESTTKDKAEYIKIDWTSNRLMNISSPLAFFDDGSCFLATASEKVVDMKMNLVEKGTLNFSIASSHTVNPSCATVLETNNYWSTQFQLNFNVKERVSFIKHDPSTDAQISKNISHIAQQAFNYGIFTLADKVNENGSMPNTNGSEKYMPMIHDFRNGKISKWYLGGINNPLSTPPARRQMLVEAAQQVVAEWNQTMRYAFKGTELSRSGDYIELVIEDAGKEAGQLGDLNRNYIWFNEIPADNGLLGVAQPAANPRTGTVHSSNVIVYTGNTFENTQWWLKMTENARAYEKQLEVVKKQLEEELKKGDAKIAVGSASTPESSVGEVLIVGEQTGANSGNNQKLINGLNKIAKQKEFLIKEAVKSLNLESAQVQSLLKADAKALTKIDYKNWSKIKELSKQTSALKSQLPDARLNKNDQLFNRIMKLAQDKRLTKDSIAFEHQVNALFLARNDLNQSAREALNRRQVNLDKSLRFNKAMAKRPGCAMYSRNEINDKALTLSTDPAENLMLNFKQNVMSTLSHELGHAFGLMHNFKGSFDKANFEFDGEKSGRNYSSIMDYMGDIDQMYAGPGPYDAHAIRAGYTGIVQISETLLANPNFKKLVTQGAITLVDENKLSIDDIVKISGVPGGLVNITKSAINPKGFLKPFEQCNDVGTYESLLCARFDYGTTAFDIINNKIQDYDRSYVNRNFVHNKINFGQEQEINTLIRNINLFSEIREFLDETFRIVVNGSGKSEQDNEALIQDLVKASLKGYQFFNEVIRTPSAKVDGNLKNLNKRLMAVPYTYKKQNAETGAVEDVKTFKLIEARSEGNIALTAEKYSTLGIGMDKVFALRFLMETTDASRDLGGQLLVSYKLFEQLALGIEDTKNSLVVNTLTDILSDNLALGFFDPNGELLQVNSPLQVSQNLENQAAVSGLLDLMDSQNGQFDIFANAFKVGTSYIKSSPKDGRYVVTAPNSDPKNLDTVGYFAIQNGIGSNALITKAAESQNIILNKEEIFKVMAELLKADQAYMPIVSQIIDKSCQVDEQNQLVDEAACTAAQQKPIEEHLAGNQIALAAKAKSDKIAQKLTQLFRKLNKTGLIMSASLDQASSAVNFEQQVLVIRSLFTQQIGLFNSVKDLLESSTAETEQAIISALVQQLAALKEENDKLLPLKAVAVAQDFLIQALKEEKILIGKDANKEIDGSVIMELSMTGDKTEEKYSKAMEIVGKLGLYTSILDPFVPSVTK